MFGCHATIMYLNMHYLPNRKYVVARLLRVLLYICGYEIAFSKLNNYYNMSLTVLPVVQ